MCSSSVAVTMAARLLLLSLAAPAALALSASGDSLGLHTKRIQSLHATFASAASPSSPDAAAHNTRQQNVFNDAAAFFASKDAVPPEVVPILRSIVEAAQLRPSERVLDVGTGTGALLPYLVEAGVSEANLVGVDLSDGMLTHASGRFPEARFLRADICDVRLAGSNAGPADAATSDGTHDEAAAIDPVDVVIFNACFGNLWSQPSALCTAASLLLPNGRVLISHPLGRGFVDELRASDPQTVPHSLPSREQLMRMLCENEPCAALKLERLEGASTDKTLKAQVESNGAVPTRAEAAASVERAPYIALLRLGVVRRLRTCIGLGGAVATGFGRGSRKLGTPTANLPCSLFQERLADLPTGVYLGYARVRGAVHKAVANVGFSPTFGDDASPEKVVETFVMHEFESDFYGEPMKLLLLGFQRSEKKFDSFDALVAAINSDVQTARSELDGEILSEMRNTPWLQQDLRTGDGCSSATYEEFDAVDLLEAALSANP